MNKLSIEKVKNDTKLSISVIHYIEKVSQYFYSSSIRETRNTKWTSLYFGIKSKIYE